MLGTCPSGREIHVHSSLRKHPIIFRLPNLRRTSFNDMSSASASETQQRMFCHGNQPIRKGGGYCSSVAHISGLLDYSGTEQKQYSFRLYKADQRISPMTDFERILRLALQKQKQKQKQKRKRRKRNEHGERDSMRSLVGTTRLDLIKAW